MIPTSESTLDVFTHVSFEGAGAIVDAAADRGITVRTHRLWADEALPDMATVERLVVMGGPMGALDDEAHPYLADERRFLHEATTRGVPILGVCLGAQLLAASFGAKVYQGPTPEIGAGHVTLSPNGAHDPLLGQLDTERIDVFHWHGDTFELPEGAVHLASSDRYANQAFRIGSSYGFQFHVELRAADAETVAAHLGRHHDVTAAELAKIEPSGRRIIDAFLDLSTTPPG